MHLTGVHQPQYCVDVRKNITDDYDDIMEEMSRRDVIEYDIDIDNEEDVY